MSTKKSETKSQHTLCKDHCGDRLTFRYSLHVGCRQKSEHRRNEKTRQREIDVLTISEDMSGNEIYRYCTYYFVCPNDV